VQPAMRPVFNTKQAGDVLLSVARELGTDIGGGASTYYDFLRARWSGVAAGVEAWRDAVRRGGSFPAVAATGEQAAATNLAAGAASSGTGGVGAPAAGAAVTAATQGAAAPAQEPPAGAATPAAGNGQLHLVVYPSYRFYDGRTANRPWLLELPDPLTKVPWDSWVELHPRTARELGIEQGDVVEVTSPYGSLRTFAYVYPGLRPDVIAIQTGLGHDAFGRWTEGVGVNPNVLLPGTVDAGSGALAQYGTTVSVTRVSGPPRNLGWEAGPGLFEQGVRVQHDREIAQAVSLAQLAQIASEPAPETQPRMGPRGGGGFAPREVDPSPTGYPPIESRYGEYIEGAARWAMVIDLSRCIGCAACVIACQAENNIPVVGPKEIKRGRDLAWLRIERYYGVGRDPE